MVLHETGTTSYFVHCPYKKKKNKKKQKKKKKGKTKKKCRKNVEFFTEVV